MVVACGVDTPHELKVKNEKLKVESGVKSKKPPPNLVQRGGKWRRWILKNLLCKKTESFKKAYVKTNEQEKHKEIKCE
jgi:hypothetical protein